MDTAYAVVHIRYVITLMLKRICNYYSKNRLNYQPYQLQETNLRIILCVWINRLEGKYWFFSSPNISITFLAPHQNTF
jgi:hypothetical protein